MLKSITAVTAAIALTACSGSQIKQIRCTTDAGEWFETYVFDTKAKAVYEYDSFSEILIPFEAGNKKLGLPAPKVAFTDSGKIKLRTGSASKWVNASWNQDNVIDLKAMTFKMTSTETDDSGTATKTLEGTCKYEKPISTTVADE